MELFRSLDYEESDLHGVSLAEYQCAGWADASYAPTGEKELKSVSGYMFTIYGSVVSWKSKLQPITAGSTHEAELIALSTASNEGVWLHRLMGELKVVRTGPIQFLNFVTEDPTSSSLGMSGDANDVKLRPIMLFGDNRGSLFTATNPEVSSNSKHVHVRFYKIREYIKLGLIRVRYCRTTFNLSDFFTKGLARVRFEEFRRFIMNSTKALDSATFILGNQCLSTVLSCWEVSPDAHNEHGEMVHIVCDVVGRFGG